MRKIFSFFVVASLCTFISCNSDSALISIDSPTLELRTEDSSLSITALTTNNQTVNFTATQFNLSYTNATTLQLVVNPGTDGQQTVNVSTVTITGNNAVMALSCRQGQNQTLFEEVEHMTAQPGSGLIQLNLDYGSIITTATEVVGDEMEGV